jgi:hypothetical protein
MAKPRVGVLLRETVAGSKSSNQSADLESLKQKYLVFCKKIRHLIGALERHHKAMTEMEQSRSGVSVFRWIIDMFPVGTSGICCSATACSLAFFFSHCLL